MAWKPLNLNNEEAAAFQRDFRKNARFLLDESIDPIVAGVLRKRGFNVRTSDDLSLRGHSDEDYLAAAHREDRILVTHDDDFLDDRRFPPHRNPGVVVLTGGSGNVDQLADAVEVVIVLIAPYREIWRGSKVKIWSDGEISVRGQEADSGRRRERRYRMAQAGPALEWVD